MRTVVACLIILEIVSCYTNATAFSETRNCTTDDAIPAWIRNHLEWTKTMKRWKEEVENSCSTNEFQQLWDEVFACTLSVQCINENQLNCLKDAFGCDVCYCNDKKYKCGYSLQDAWKIANQKHNNAMEIYEAHLKNCQSSCSDQEDVATTTVEDEAPPTTSTVSASTTHMAPTVVDETTAPPTTQTVSSSTADTDPCEIVASNGDCFWIYNNSAWFNFADAEKFCADDGGVVGVIPDATMYNRTLELVQTKSSRMVLRIWTGLKYDSVTDTVSDTDAFISWLSSFPLRHTQNNAVLVRIDVEEGSHGMFNEDPTSSYNFALCRQLNTLPIVTTEATTVEVTTPYDAAITTESTTEETTIDVTTQDITTKSTTETTVDVTTQDITTESTTEETTVEVTTEDITTELTRSTQAKTAYVATTTAESTTEETTVEVPTPYPYVADITTESTTEDTTVEVTTEDITTELTRSTEAETA